MLPQKPLLVGELNPYGADPKFALYPLPENASGHRLCKLVMNLEMTTYIRRFDRVNLCVGKWSMKTAREAATRIFMGRAADAGPVVLLGAKVCTAFAVEFKPFTMFTLESPPYKCRGVILGHPSGLNRLWNEPGAFERARAVLREAGVL